ncbi:HAD family hydrolase [[Eubacterium] cellulosolvens]
MKIEKYAISDGPISMQNIELLIFDLDGTLVDSRKDLTNAVNHVRQNYRLSALEVDTVTMYIGNGQRKLLERSLPKKLWFKIEEASHLFREYYNEHALDNTSLYPGVKEILHYFRNKKMAVVSNKPEGFSKAILKGLRVDSYFTLILGGDTTKIRKPHPEPILQVINRLKTERKLTVLIGDSPIDIEAGRQADVLTCAVTYGFRSRELILKSKPDFIIDDIRGLKKIFN